VAASNGHTALVAAPDEQFARTPRTDRAFEVSRARLVEALKLNTRPTTAFGFYLDDRQPGEDEAPVTVICIIPSALTNGSFRESITKSPSAFVRAPERTLHAGDDASGGRVAATRYGFPPIENVIPKYDDRAPTAIGMWSCGSHYLAQIASIGRACAYQLVGGAITRLHLPTKSSLDPMVATIEDRDLNLLWIYVVMPVKL
jgi:hypothetical protein